MTLVKIDNNLDSRWITHVIPKTKNWQSMGNLLTAARLMLIFYSCVALPSEINVLIN